MSNLSFIDNLNKEQKEAVTNPLENMVIVAGAGTGKTTVLVSRIAYIISNYKVSPYNILAITFTNKAAKELKTRIISTLDNKDSDSIVASTFHSFCLLVLRRFYKEANLDKNFLVYSTKEQENLLKNIAKSLPETEVILQKDLLDNIKFYLDKISSLKEKALRSKDYINSGFSSTSIRIIYSLYEDYCNKNSIVDFSELILRTVELLRSNKDVLYILQNRFKQILVDEFQDTSLLQYELIKLLVGDKSNLTVVGDDDQSIYAWRGAKKENLTLCQQDFNSKIITLNQNYRSNQTILDFANCIINKSEDRLVTKNLVSIKEENDEDAVTFFRIDNDNLLAVATVKIIIDLLKTKKYNYDEIAVLYRKNSQSIHLEKIFTKNNIPYKVYGSVSFYEREEILNLVSYLKLVLSNNDDNALLRIINVPIRKIGKVTIDNLISYAKQRNIHLFDAIEELYFLEKNTDTDKTILKLAKTLTPFYLLIKKLRDSFSLEQNVTKLIFDILDYTCYIDYYKDKDLKENRANKGLTTHVDNIKEFIDDVSLFDKERNKDNLTIDGTIIYENPLAKFLSEVSLITSNDDESYNGERVKFMTIHTAKGLEFPVVILFGFEEGIMPLERQDMTWQDYEEERRLAYVAITRAKDKFYGAFPKYKYDFKKGIDVSTKPSPYFVEYSKEIKNKKKKVNLITFEIPR